MDALVLVPVGALVLLSSLRFERAPGLGSACAWAVGGVFCLFLGVRALVPDETLFFASEVSRRVRAQIEEFRKGEARDFVVVEGSSVAAYGSNPVVLQDELRRGGMDVGVLQFSAQGANHFERAFFLEAFWRGLSSPERDRLQKGRVVLLREVFDAYDNEPLYLFRKDSYTERAKVYMSPRYAWAAWEAFLNGLPQCLPLRERLKRQWEMGGLLVERILLNRFGAGACSGMEWRARKRKTGAFFALEGVKEKFDYEAAVGGMENWGDGFKPLESLPRGWIAAREFFDQSTGGWIDSEAFYAMPALEGHRRNYQLGFRHALGGPMMGPPDSGKMRDFLDKNFWFDGVHPTGKGAEAFSSWLAGELIELEKGNPAWTR